MAVCITAHQSQEQRRLENAKGHPCSRYRTKVRLASSALYVGLACDCGVLAICDCVDSIYEFLKCGATSIYTNNVRCSLCHKRRLEGKTLTFLRRHSASGLFRRRLLEQTSSDSGLQSDYWQVHVRTADKCFKLLSSS